MDAKTQQALRAINDRFYRERASEFSATREKPWPGWARVLAAAKRAGALSVLDVGCGNGRFASYLASGAVEQLRYVGIDASEPLLAIARGRCAPSERIEFHALDCLADPDALPPGPFDLVALFGVLHHVPAFATRRALLSALLTRVAEGGVLALTLWQFGNRARFSKRIVAWKTYCQSAALPLDIGDLEPGDSLVRWGEDEDAVRYCHFVDTGERERLLADLPIRRVDIFDADGREGDLNQYLLVSPL